MHYLLCFIIIFHVTISHAYTDPLIKITHQAQQGNIDSQLELATAYAYGQGIKKDHNLAIKWYCKAAKRGSVDAQRELSWMLLNTREIDQNEALAIRWFKIAAKSGDQYSKKILTHLDKDLRTTKTICTSFPTAYWKTSKCNKDCQKIVLIVNDIAPGYNIEPLLVLSLIQYESNFNSKAKSHKNAIGLMQLLPETAKRFGVKNIWDPEQNIQGGIRYLRWLLKEFQGNVAFTLAGYNAGEQTVLRYKGVPPYKETRHYVKKILKLYGKTTHPIPL